MPIIGSSYFAIGTFLLFNSVLNYLGDAYPDYAASVLAGNDFMRSSFGAGFPLFATAMYKNEGIGWASSILGFLAIVFIPIPFVLYKVCLSITSFAMTETDNATTVWGKAPEGVQACKKRLLANYTGHGAISVPIIICSIASIASIDRRSWPP